MDAARATGNRIAELDAVRGLAAVCVVLGHLTLALVAVGTASRSNGLTPWNVLLYSPLHVLFDGGAAVIVFFVLSGFVLAVSYESGRQTYGGFLVRRVARIWIPYAVAVAGAMLLATVIADNAIPGTSGWFTAPWRDAVGVVPLLQHVSLIGHYGNDAEYLPVIWSLTDEMRISIVFPVLIAAVAAFGWRRSVVASVVLTAIGLALSRKVSADFATLEYVLCFVAGIVLAAHRRTLVERLRSWSRRDRQLLFAVALLLFTWESWYPPAWAPGPLSSVVHSEGVHVVFETAGAAAFIVLAQVPGPVHDLLLRRLPQYLGRISYSLYLVHTTVLLAVGHLLGGHVALAWLLAPVFLVSIAVADLMQRTVERPAQRLGRRWAGRVESGARRPPVPAVASS
ncbi:MAG TPA: acyltransferase [Baekduia sp.]|jgi:peptidoglycan/LPS O-acetylase OafA/YrhL